MNPVIILGGIALGARLLSFIFGELTENEKKKAEEIRKKIDSYNADYEQAKAENAAEAEAFFVDKATSLRQYLIEEAEERIGEEESLYNEIKDAIRKISECLKDSQTTALRRNSLLRLKNQIYEAKERCFGYQKYLKRYQKLLGSQNDKSIREFSMKMPPDYPYVGKVIYFNADELKNGQIMPFVTQEGIQLQYELCDEENIDMLQSGMRLPFMVVGFDVDNFCYILSLDKGTFSEEALSNTHVGVEVSVKEIQKKGVILQYGNSLRLFMPDEYLLRPNRRPPVRANVTVYPLKWEYALSAGETSKCPVTVSERKEDAAASLSFSYIPLMITLENLTALLKELNEGGILEMEDEWKIGPADKGMINMRDGMMLKFQFGDCLLIEARLREYTSESNSAIYYPEYTRTLPLTECFSSDDIFVDLDATLTPVLLTSENFRKNITNHITEEELHLFMMDIFSELYTQKKIELSMAGSRYYQVWSEITEKLISYMKKGQTFYVRPGEITEKSKRIIITIANPDELKNHINWYMTKYNLKYARRHISYIFIDDSERSYSASVSADCRNVTIFGCGAEAVKNKNHIILYAEEIPYAEIKQISALSHFRIGKLMNPKLQAFLMDGKNIEPETDVLCNLKPVNANILNNKVQCEALTRAYNENNIFFIQGPPGTGKTTVIRELVEQYLKRDDIRGILIVSQANVAVDNALSGIVKNHSDIVVRCGNADKIESELQAVRLDKYYSDYVAGLQRDTSRKSAEIYDKWLDFVKPERGLNHNIGELIIKKYKIVGATCVGLAKRRIGLEKIDFDLVIIDEAGKALPGEVLIPVLRAKKLIMIGDHRQLPPVINPALYNPEEIELSNRKYVENNLFKTSLFERLYNQAPESNKIMLTRQFRMPAVIGTLVSDLFYDGKLENGEGTNLKKPIYSDSNLVMYDFSEDKTYHEDRDTGNCGVINYREADYAISLAENINKKSRGHSLAIITPYRGQKRLIRNYMLKSNLLKEADIKIDTVDAFQGEEAEIVIYCSTRSKKPTNYFSNEKRINVALSRAKNELIIIGSINYFKKNKKSVLPKLASAIEKTGKCIKIKTDENWKKSGVSNERIIPINEIFCQNFDAADEDAINKHISYYYTKGKMSAPLTVTPYNDIFMLKSDIDLYQAYIDLNLDECWVKIE